MFLPAAAVLSAWVLSAYMTKFPLLAFTGRHNSYSMGVLGLSLAFAYYLASRGDISEAVGLGGAAMGVHALAQQAGVDALAVAAEGGRSFGTIGNPVSLGQVLAMTLPFALSRSWVYATAVCLGIWASGSRGAVLSALVGLGAWRWAAWVR